MVVTRWFDAPARLVYRAWTLPELFRQWWVPKSLGLNLLSCAQDVRVGGGYRLEFARDGAPPMAFFGRYTEVVPNARLVWTNEESPDGQITTVTFEEENGRTRVTMHERYPNKAALDAALEGMDVGIAESFAQLDAFLVTLAAEV